MTTRGQVKINGNYDTINADTAPVAEKSPIYLNGHRWLVLSDGKSYELTDDDVGTWVQIETALDAKIDAVLSPTFNRVFNECIPVLLRQRQVALDESPDTITRNDLYYLVTYVCLYAKWTIAGAAFSVDDVDDIVGDLEDFEYEDEVYIFGTRRNDGIKGIVSVDAAGITFDTAGVGTEDRAVIALVDTPTDLELIVGRMIWYDVVLKLDGMGLSSEKTGTYGIVTQFRLGSFQYPQDVVAGLDAYLSKSPIADQEWIP